MDGVQLPQGYRATAMRQFTFLLFIVHYIYTAFDAYPTLESWGVLPMFCLLGYV